jgi:predicted PurR-regulated permease PerM
MISPTPPPVSSPPWSSITKRTVALICLVVGGILFWQIADVLPIVVISAVLAFLLNPLTTFLERQVLAWLPGSRIWAIILTFVIVILLLILVVLVIFPVLFAQFADFARNLPEVLSNLQASLTETFSQPLSFRGEPIIIDGQPLVPMQQLDQFLGGDNLTGSLQSFDLLGATRTFFSSLTGPAFSVLGGAFRTLINLLFLATLMFYLLKDGAKFAEAAVRVTPESHKNDVRRLLYELSEVWKDYLRGQLLLGFFIGGLTLIVALVLGVPNAAVLALLAGILEFVPNLGPLIAMIPAALLALFSQSTTLPFLEGPTFAIVVIIAWIAIQNIESILIVPRVMGDSLDLHPVVIIVGVIAGASLAGTLGVILAAPVIASLRVIGQYIYGKLLDKPMFVELEPHPPQPGWLERVIPRGSNRLPVVKSLPPGEEETP